MMQWALGGIDSATAAETRGAAAGAAKANNTGSSGYTNNPAATPGSSARRIENDKSDVVDDWQFVPTATRQRFEELQKLQMQQEQRQREQQNRPIESIVDPPGFRSKWKQSTLEYFNAEIAYNKSRTNELRVNRHRMKPNYDVSASAVSPLKSDSNADRQGAAATAASNDDDSSLLSASSSTLGRSWVPVTDTRKDFPSADARRRQEARAWERQRATAGVYQNPYLSWETRTALTSTLPTKSWTPHFEQDNNNENNKNGKDQKKDKKQASVSWAPHVDPNNPEALTPYPPQNAVAGESRVGTESRVESVEYDEEEIIEEEILDESSNSRSESDSFIEIVDSDESDVDERPNSFVPKQVRRTLLSHSSQGDDSGGSNSSHSRSDSTDSLFARDGAGGREKTSGGQNKSSQSSASTASSLSDVESGCLGIFSPIDKNDNFQVFDEDCIFAPTRGTMIVMCLCTVCAAVWAALLVYFLAIR